MALPLRSEQQEDLNFLLNDREGRGMHLGEPGTGKTPTLCRFMEEIGGRSIWVQPTSLMYKNKRELHRFTEFEDHEVQIGDNLDDPDVKVWIMSAARFRKHKRDIRKVADAVISDEFHRDFSTHNTATTNALQFCMRGMPYFVPMTGSLISGRLDSAYTALNVVEPRFYPNYNAFMHFHGDEIDDRGKVRSWKNHERLSEVLSRLSIMRTFESIHGKQEVVFQTEDVTPSQKHLKLYNRFHEEAMIELNQFDVDGGDLPGVAFIRARQLLEHPQQMYDPNNRKVKESALKSEQYTAKEQALMIHLDHAQRTGKPVVVFTPLKEQQLRIRALMAQMGLHKPEIMNGDVPALERDRIDQEFQRGEVQAMVVSPEVASFGYNWQFWGGKEVDTCIFMTVDWLDSSVFQAYKRFIRENRSTPLRVLFLRYPGTVDAQVYRIVERKSIDANQIDSARDVYKF